MTTLFPTCCILFRDTLNTDRAGVSMDGGSISCLRNQQRKPMGTRDELLKYLWTDLINRFLRDDSVDNIVAHCKRFPGTAFTEVGPIIERLLAAAASRRDLCLLLRAATYEATFGTLYALSDPGVDDNNVFGLYEELLTADPSGRAGDPGSADAI